MDDIPDSRTNKLLLYQARKIKQLKVQIESYQKARGSYASPSEPGSTVAKESLHDSQAFKAKKVRTYFKYGADSHIKDSPKNYVLILNVVSIMAIANINKT